MEGMREEYSVLRMADVFEMNRSGFYKWKDKPVSNREMENKKIEAEILSIFGDTKGIYGSPRIFEELKDKGIKCSKNKTADLMRKMNLRAKASRKFRVTTNSKHNLPVAENLLNRNFKVEEPNQVWTSDITYIRTWEGWLYFCAVLDLFSRKVIGWSMGKYLNADLAIDALDMAYQKRKPKKGLMFHSDQGVQYASHAFRTRLEQYGMIQSMSRRGNCWDNAPTESFFHSLKVEAFEQDIFRTRNDAEREIFKYTEIFYNRKRKHSYLAMKSPEIFEKNHRECIFKTAG
jgi:transposase InsO family protein